MKNKHILIISTKLDLATDAVVRYLSSKDVKFTRLNSEDFPFHTNLSLKYDEDIPYKNNILYEDFLGNKIDISNVSSIWFRKFRNPEKPSAMNEGTFDFCIKEARNLIFGIINNYNKKIMSHPEKIYTAELKPYQLKIAKEVGFKIPDTIISNDPEEIKKHFFQFNKKMIVKSVKSGYAKIENECYSIYTSEVLEEHLEHISSARLCPSIYQKHIEKKSELRITYVDGKIFVAEIDSQSDIAARIDWRQTINPDLPHKISYLPESIHKKIIDFMTKLGLVFGALDFIITPNGEYIFLEVNPNGQWLWLDDILDLGITESIGNWLMN